jgi:hypothetical protein
MRWLGLVMWLLGLGRLGMLRGAAPTGSHLHGLAAWLAAGQAALLEAAARMRLASGGSSNGVGVPKVPLRWPSCIITVYARVLCDRDSYVCVVIAAPARSMICRAPGSARVPCRRCFLSDSPTRLSVVGWHTCARRICVVAPRGERLGECRESRRQSDAQADPPDCEPTSPCCPACE